ncbi:penicillin-binding protein 1A [Maribellus maritimus]|uniref:penicillin-binding protein 1A n=1 Tax=Maribellus maritimus TaxID=2870838 RepID=UPI001EEAEDFF|nr:transglycosylase domain-containing protein [Maribellus maritimus]MCG6189467.1 transglycosylase domain-containing protein [Maribellus maritimus]
MATKKTSNTRSAKKAPLRTKQKAGRGKKRKILPIVLKSAGALMLLGIIFFLLVFLGILGPVPSSYQLKQISTPVASEVYSADGKVLGRYYVENRSNIRFEAISPNVINALVATEDARFYEHRGIDEIALLRVLVKSILLRDKSAGGGSTLSQQIAKNLFPREELGPFSMPVNKLREAIIAYRLERIYSKQEILAMYLNTVPFSENIYGIEVAAERFFSKKPANLELHEAAVLVGLLKANNYYNPRKYPEHALDRRNLVIDQMAKYEYITNEQAEKYKAKPLEIKYRVISYNQGPAPYFLEMLKPQLLEWCKNNTNEKGENYNLYTDGLKIKTTIDYNLQYYAQQSVKEYMKNLQKVFDNHWKSRDIFRENPEIIRSAIRRIEKEKGNSNIDIDKALASYNKEITTSLFTWDDFKEVQITRLDSLKHYLKLLNAGFIAVEPQNGDLKAWVGGIDFRFFKYDHVKAARQTGSTFKPFVYLAALETGLSPDRYFENKFTVYEDYDNWAPRNSHEEYQGYYTMKGALAQSINTISVDVLLETGVSNVIDVAKSLGISADLPQTPSLALGVASISLKEIVEAYAGIVNDGSPVQAHYLLEIMDNNGNTLETFGYPGYKKSRLSPENCRAVINMMEAVVEVGTGKGIRTVYHIPGDFAGKTGTTQNSSDGWFIGITPNLVTGCWVGADDPRVHFRTTTYGQGAYMALPIVGKFFYKTYRDQKFASLKYSTFKQPEPELLAMLDEPQYKEILEADKKFFDLAKIFGGKDDAELKERKERQVEEQKTRPLWNAIKSIFKKKK